MILIIILTIKIIVIFDKLFESSRIKNLNRIVDFRYIYKKIAE
jgi:hypothetical protein